MEEGKSDLVGDLQRRLLAGGGVVDLLGCLVRMADGVMLMKEEEVSDDCLGKGRRKLF